MTARGLLRATGWFAAIVLAGLVAAAVAVYYLLPRSGLTPAPHDWTAEWRTDPPVVSTLPGGLLETATIRMGEDFYKSDALTWWGLYLGNTASHIQVAATYRYGVPLADPGWEIVTKGQIAVVVAPVLQAEPAGGGGHQHLARADRERLGPVRQGRTAGGSCAGASRTISSSAPTIRGASRWRARPRAGPSASSSRSGC